MICVEGQRFTFIDQSPVMNLLQLTKSYEGIIPSFNTCHSIHVAIKQSSVSFAHVFIAVPLRY